MNMFDLPFEQILQFIIVMIRVASIIAFVPFLGSRNILMRTKLGFAVMTAFVVFPFVNFDSVKMSTDLFPFAISICSEVMIGIVIGYASRLIFLAIQMAGHLIGFQIGFSIVNVLDPQTNSQVSIVSQFENIVAMLIFLSTNAHFIFLQAIADSFTLIPPLGFVPSHEIVTIVINFFTEIFALSLRIAAPVLAALMFTHVALGLIARSVPQINVFIVGFPLQIGIGLFMLGVTISFFNVIMKNLTLQMNSTIYMLLRAM